MRNGLCNELMKCVCIVVCLPPTFVRGHVNESLFVHSTLSLKGETKGLLTGTVNRLERKSVTG